ncbi:uncharacterized protein FA14DRAFT_159909 [Meira miltonrushii]|uniref:CID domain-containing protein n=1 Tax=Meira miltonrushii TaxID=1280837 RepID=A0A316VKY2_9BASI|nr:uncharacterized protein FA14DRAFT_159909 [Meira miltonrushii]PWN38262.1 hypothetical protein FA14DRAFT_159909 [Meira miltonrushii]
MDVFQIRLDCIALVKKINASQQAIAKVVDFAVKYASVAADDVWDCIITECEKASLNTKLNILFLLDALLLSIVDPVGYSSFSDPGSSSTKLEGSSSSNSSITASTYLTLASRDLGRIVHSVVPKEDWDAVRMNATDTQKVLSSWKRVGMFDLAGIDASIHELQIRKEALSKLPSSSHTRFSKQDTLRRIEEDRERHKRLRERVWILPAKSFADAVPQRAIPASNKPALSSAKKIEGAKAASSSTTKPDALNIEFDDMWESVSDLNEDDYDKMQDIDRKWWGSVPFHEKQLTMEKERLVANQPDVTIEQDDERKRRRSTELEEQTTPKRKNDQDDERKDYSDRKSRDDRPPPNRWRKIGPSHHSEGDNKSSTSRGGSYENNWKRRNNNQNRRNRW